MSQSDPQGLSLQTEEITASGRTAASSEGKELAFVQRERSVLLITARYGPGRSGNGTLLRHSSQYLSYNGRSIEVELE